jgi:hypothetical protein
VRLLKLSGRSRSQVRRQLASGNVAERNAELWTELYRSGACVRREFPFYGEQAKLELQRLSVAQREEEQSVIRGYETQMKLQSAPEVRRMRSELELERARSPIWRWFDAPAMRSNEDWRTAEK